MAQAKMRLRLAWARSDPSVWVREHPLGCVAAAVAVGLALGRWGRPSMLLPVVRWWLVG